MSTQTIIKGAPFTLDSVRECEGLIFDTIINLEYEPSDRAQVQIESLGTGVDEFTKYVITSLVVMFDNEEIILK